MGGAPVATRQALVAMESTGRETLLVRDGQGPSVEEWEALFDRARRSGLQVPDTPPTTTADMLAVLASLRQQAGQAVNQDAPQGGGSVPDREQAPNSGRGNRGRQPAQAPRRPGRGSGVPGSGASSPRAEPSGPRGQRRQSSEPQRTPSRAQPNSERPSGAGATALAGPRLDNTSRTWRRRWLTPALELLTGREPGSLAESSRGELQGIVELQFPGEGPSIQKLARRAQANLIAFGLPRSSGVDGQVGEQSHAAFERAVDVFGPAVEPSGDRGQVAARLGEFADVVRVAAERVEASGVRLPDDPEQRLETLVSTYAGYLAARGYDVGNDATVFNPQLLQAHQASLEAEASESTPPAQGQGGSAQPGNAAARGATSSGSRRPEGTPREAGVFRSSERSRTDARSSPRGATESATRQGEPTRSAASAAPAGSGDSPAALRQRIVQAAADIHLLNEVSTADARGIMRALTALQRASEQGDAAAQTEYGRALQHTANNLAQGGPERVADFMAQLDSSYPEPLMEALFVDGVMPQLSGAAARQELARELDQAGVSEALMPQQMVKMLDLGGQTSGAQQGGSAAEPQASQRAASRTSGGAQGSQANSATQPAGTRQSASGDARSSAPNGAAGGASNTARPASPNPGSDSAGARPPSGATGQAQQTAPAASVGGGEMSQQEADSLLRRPWVESPQPTAAGTAHSVSDEAAYAALIDAFEEGFRETARAFNRNTEAGRERMRENAREFGEAIARHASSRGSLQELAQRSDLESLIQENLQRANSEDGDGDEIKTGNLETAARDIADAIQTAARTGRVPGLVGRSASMSQQEADALLSGAYQPSGQVLYGAAHGLTDDAAYAQLIDTMEEGFRETSRLFSRNTEAGRERMLESAQAFGEAVVRHARSRGNLVQLAARDDLEQVIQRQLAEANRGDQDSDSIRTDNLERSAAAIADTIRQSVVGAPQMYDNLVRQVENEIIRAGDGRFVSTQAGYNAMLAAAREAATTLANELESSYGSDALIELGVSGFEPVRQAVDAANQRDQANDQRLSDGYVRTVAGELVAELRAKFVGPIRQYYQFVEAAKQTYIGASGGRSMTTPAANTAVAELAREFAEGLRGYMQPEMEEDQLRALLAEQLHIANRVEMGDDGLSASQQEHMVDAMMTVLTEGE